MAKAAFYISVFLISYNYVLYPVLIMLLARKRPDIDTVPPSQDTPPTATLVIAAYNEERVIEAKIKNSLALNYPKDRLHILIVTDGSSDGTPDIVRRYADQGVRLLHDAPRRGKTAALNRAVAATTTDIVVFSDANNMFNENALRELVKHFADPRVGGVCGIKQIYSAPDRESSLGDSLYWRYESAIKQAESRFDSITNADGEIFAIRRSLYESIDESVINDDAEITFSLVRKGYRVLYERAAASFEHASIRIEDDFYVKVRMVSGGFQIVVRHWWFLFPPRQWFALAFVSHKLLRWLAPELMIVIALTSLRLIDETRFLAVVILQVIFYSLAIAGWRARGQEHVSPLIYVPFYFCAMNLAALLGLYRYIVRTQTTHWRKAER